ncbi:MAG: hypothetical protein FRX49_08772 [Trebouxia sp. A1-2]|nr:MAG: hypothetical protein FRX49_08772 [Trebouxia sp. A1-2]
MACEDVACNESFGDEIRAYKLGKGRWSYNQCELVLQQQAAEQDASLTGVRVTEAIHINSRVVLPTSGHQVPFQLRLNNGYMISITVSLVYEKAHPVHQTGNSEADDRQTSFLWTPVTRDECSKGCSGPTLKTLQRFGTFGRRSNGPHPVSLSSDRADRKAKQAKYMYLSIDEAATHVGNKKFRLVAMVYEQNGQDLIGTTCSQPIRVMANNDVPTGAAHIRLSCNIRQEWRGWTYTGPMLSRRCLWPSLPAPDAQLDAAAPAHLASTPLAAHDHERRFNSHWGEDAAATAATGGSTPMAACVGAQPPHQGLVPASPPAMQPSAQAAVGHELADASSGKQVCRRPCVSEGGSSDEPASAFDGLALTSSSSAECAWHDAMAASRRSLKQSPAAPIEEILAYEQDLEAGSQQPVSFLPAPLVNFPLADQISWASLGDIVSDVSPGAGQEVAQHQSLLLPLNANTAQQAQEGQEQLLPAPKARCLQPMPACAAPCHHEGFWEPSQAMCHGGEVSSMPMYEESSSGGGTASDDSLELIEYYQLANRAWPRLVHDGKPLHKRCQQPAVHTIFSSDAATLTGASATCIGTMASHAKNGSDNTSRECRHMIDKVDQAQAVAVMGAQESRQHLQKLKRKLDLQAEQLRHERHKVAHLEKDMFSSRSEVHWLRRRVSQLQEAQHVAKSTAARAATSSQRFDYIELPQLWQQENLVELPFESSGAEQQANAAFLHNLYHACPF